MRISTSVQPQTESAAANRNRHPRQRPAREPRHDHLRVVPESRVAAEISDVMGKTSFPRSTQSTRMARRLGRAGHGIVPATALKQRTAPRTMPMPGNPRVNRSGTVLPARREAAARASSVVAVLSRHLARDRAVRATLGCPRQPRRPVMREPGTADRIRISARDRDCVRDSGQDHREPERTRTQTRDTAHCHCFLYPSSRRPP